MRPRPLSADRRELLDRLLDEQQVAPRASLIPRSTVDRDRLPLSFAQQRLWFFDQLQPGSALYNMVGATRLHGTVDSSALGRCLTEVVRRHEILRTTYHQDDDEPWARVRPAQEIPLPTVDLSGLAADEREAAMARHHLDEAHRPFDLTRDPMLRGVLLRTAPDEHVLLLSMHHIAADGWSLGVLLRELMALYPAYASGTPPTLPETAIQYADFTVWQRDRVGGQELERQLAYWTRQLAAVPPVELPADRPHRGLDSFAGQTVPIGLPADLVSRIRALGNAERATTYMVLQAAFVATLCRWSGQSDVVVGASISGREHPEVANLIGFFVNTLALRVDLSGDPTFRELLGRVRESCLAAYAHSDVPFDHVVEALQPDRDPSTHTPLFRHTLVMHDTPHPRFELPGLSGDVMPLRTATAKFDVRVELTPDQHGALAGVVEYSSELYHPESMRRFVASLVTLIETAVADPDRPISSLDLVDQAERDRLLRDLSGVGSVAAGDGCVHELFEHAVDQASDAVAVVDGDTRLSYRELDQWANRIAWRLTRAGVSRETPVAVCLPHSAELVAVLLGVLKAGATFVPLDPTYPAARLAHLAADCAAAVLVTRSALVREQPEVAGDPDRPMPRIVWLDAEAEAIATLPATRPGVVVDPENCAYVVYTSGSTGFPKGAANTHRAVANRVRAMRDAYGYDATDTSLYRTPVGFDVSIGEWALALTSGARLVVAGPDVSRDPARLAGLLADEQVTTCNVVPSLLNALLAVPDAARCGQTLRRVLCGGEVLSPDLVRQCQRALPEADLFNLYGPTEAAIDVTTLSLSGDREATELVRIPIGRPVPGAHLRILDSRLEPVPVGIPGELYIGGVPLARGYHRRPALTAERFVPDPYAVGGRLYRTGDRARWLPDGSVDFLGRVDEQVKIRGQRIEPAEIEAVLASHDAVDQAVVTTWQDAAGESLLAGYVTVRERARTHVSATEHVDRFRSVFQETYDATAPVADPTANNVGWISSFTGDPLGHDEMHSWLAETTGRILALRPSRVLEIGCGVGLVLFQVALHCESYVGTDISPEALATVDRHRDVLGPASDRVDLLERAADDFSGWSDGSFDTVVLNSVVQYFPDVGYLLDVLRKAVRLVRPGGYVFLGDVRSRPLLEALHTSVLTQVSPADTTVPTLRHLIARQVAREEELVLDPALFDRFAATTPGVRSATGLLKISEPHSELTKFRYDVVLHVGDPASAPTDPDVVPWSAASTVAGFADRLTAAADVPMVLTGVPDARLREDLRAVGLARGASGGPGTVAELRKLVATPDPGSPPAVFPKEWTDLGRTTGHAVYLQPSERLAGGYDAVFWRSGAGAEPWPPPITRAAAEVAGDWRPDSYANDPLRASAERAIAPMLRTYTEQRLPEHMVPAHFFILSEWPLSPNGKLDRGALPSPQGLRPDMSGGFVAPRTAVERRITEIWRDVLEVTHIGVHDNFFDLGGHSLLAARLVARIRAEFSVNLPLGDLLSDPTVAGVAAHVAAVPAADAASPIRRAERRRRG